MSDSYSPIKTVVDTDGNVWTGRDVIRMANEKVRWVWRSKAVIVRAVQTGVLTEEEVFAQTSITPDELAMWTERYNRMGSKGLKALYRKTYVDPETPSHRKPKTRRKPGFSKPKTDTN